MRIVKLHILEAESIIYVSRIAIWNSMRMIIYNFENVCPFNYTAIVVSGKVGYVPVNQFNHTYCVDVVCYLCNWPS